jgi:protein TonB
MAQWGGQVRAKIERKKRYPAGTRAAGKVILRLRLDAAGALHSVSVRRSSGDRALDQAALNAVTQARLPRAPKGLGVGLFTFDLPMSFNR